MALYRRPDYRRRRRLWLYRLDQRSARAAAGKARIAGSAAEFQRRPAFERELRRQLYLCTRYWHIYVSSRLQARSVRSSQLDPNTQLYHLTLSSPGLSFADIVLRPTGQPDSREWRRRDQRRHCPGLSGGLRLLRRLGRRSRSAGRFRALRVSICRGCGRHCQVASAPAATSADYDHHWFALAGTLEHWAGVDQRLEARDGQRAALGCDDRQRHDHHCLGHYIQHRSRHDGRAADRTSASVAADTWLRQR